MKTKKFYKLIIFSDAHGVYLDKKAYRTFLQILKNNTYDEVNILGDIVDLPFISAHTQKIYQPDFLKNYSETGEIEFTKKNILYPLAEAVRTNNPQCKITFLEGNHDQRITKPKSMNKEQSERLNILYHNYNTTSLGEMLDFNQLKIDWHKPAFKNYFGVFKTTHGLSLTKNASLKNIYEYMSSGATGHTHRGNYTLINTRAGDYVWLETFCMRTREDVEYLPTGKIADWSNGFVEIIFDITDLNDATFYYKSHQIRDGKCYYNDHLYDGKNIWKV